jgi:hypothetical protein
MVRSLQRAARNGGLALFLTKFGRTAAPLTAGTQRDTLPLPRVFGATLELAFSAGLAAGRGGLTNEEELALRTLARPRVKGQHHGTETPQHPVPAYAPASPTPQVPQSRLASRSLCALNPSCPSFALRSFRFQTSFLVVCFSQRQTLILFFGSVSPLSFGGADSDINISPAQTSGH